MDQATAIKSMKLYTHVERVENELRAMGLAPDAPVSVDVLTRFDQLHYEGTAAVDRAARELGLDVTSQVLEVGSGLGGPARYLAATTGCSVTALELQPDLDACARRLTARCGLSDSVHHVCGDALSFPVKPGAFDAVVSWLAFLHIPDRARLLARCRSALDDDGAIYIEDFARRGPLTRADRESLRLHVYCTYLPDSGEYHDHLHRAGFRDIEITDMAEAWKHFVAGRLEAFIADRERYVELHGTPTWNAIEQFYRTVERLFADGNVGGVRIRARAAA